MSVSNFLAAQSVLDLVASDLAYNSSAPNIVGTKLRSFPDNKAQDEQAFPERLLASLPEFQQNPSSVFHSTYQNSTGIVQFDNWAVVSTFNNPRDGFGAIILKSLVPTNENKYEYIVAFRGSDSTDPQDWLANSDLAKSVWEKEGGPVIDVLTSFNDVADMHITGQSLGGGLAQYAAYDYALRLDSLSRLDRDRISLVTFNSFGAVRGLQQIYQDGFNPGLVSGIETAHFSIANDIVHRLGAGDRKALQNLGGSWHLNGLGNTYQFGFTQFSDHAPVPHPDGGFKKLQIREAHRIEAGFYRGFENTGLSFKDAKPETIYYVDTATSQNAAGALAHVFNNNNTTYWSAAARDLVALSAIVILPVDGERKEFTREITKALYESGTISLAEKKSYDGHRIPFIGKIGAAGLAALGLAVATVLEFAQNLSDFDKAKVREMLNSLMPANKKIRNMDFDFPVQTSDADKLLMYGVASLNLARYLDAASIDAMFDDPAERELAKGLTLLRMDDAKLGSQFASGDAWVRNSLNVFGQAILSAPTLSTTQKLTAIQELEFSYARDALAAASGNLAFIDRVRNDLIAFAKSDLVAAIGNANPDTFPQQSAAITIAPTSTFEQVWNLTNSFLETFKAAGRKAVASLSGASSAEAAEVARQVGDIEEAARAAAQSVVVRQTTGLTLSSLDAFDATSTVIASGTISENGSRYFTLYLPYSAGSGGQKVLLRTTGGDTDKIRLNAGADVPNVNGTFTVTVPEGSKQLVLAFVEVGDIDADSAVEINAQLVDAEGNPTHQEHLEATLTLHGVTEPEGMEAPGSTTVTVLGDRRDREFTDFVDAASGTGGGGFIPFVPPGPNEVQLWISPGFQALADWVNLTVIDAAYDIESSVFDPDTGITTITYRVTNYEVRHNSLDELGNLITEDVPEPDKAERLFGSVGADLIDARGGNDRIDAKAGDDTVYAGTGNDDVDAGAGNDWVEGGDGEDYLYGDEGNDRLIGGAGIDFLSGDVSRNYVVNRGFVPDSSTQLAGDDVLEGGVSAMDMLIGGGGRDSIYANVKVDTDLAIEEGDTFTGSGERGDWLDGGAGDDIVVGAQDNEVLFGGSGGDLIIGGAGDDHINGDASYISQFFDWEITETVETVGNETTYTYNYGVVFNDGDTGEAGDDRIYAGAGSGPPLSGRCSRFRGC
jgi:Ca2+-binding RTX toxin-like protein